MTVDTARQRRFIVMDGLRHHLDEADKQARLRAEPKVTDPERNEFVAGLCEAVVMQVDRRGHPARTYVTALAVECIRWLEEHETPP